MEENNKQICLIDGDSFLWFSCLPNPLLNEIGEKCRGEDGNIIYDKPKTYQEVENCWNEYLKSISEYTNCNNLIIALTLTGSYRKIMYPSYKSNRSESKIPEKLNWLKDKLLVNKNIIGVKGLEADDILYSLNKQYSNSFIVSIDQDLLFTEGKRFNWRNKTWINCTKEEEIKKICSDLICGQSGDQIYGIPSKGIKYFEKLYSKNIELISNNIENLYEIVIKEYINYYKSSKLGLEKYIENYNQLKLLDNLKLDILL